MTVSSACLREPRNPALYQRRSQRSATGKYKRPRRTNLSNSPVCGLSEFSARCRGRKRKTPGVQDLAGKTHAHIPAGHDRNSKRERGAGKAGNSLLGIHSGRHGEASVHHHSARSANTKAGSPHDAARRAMTAARRGRGEGTRFSGVTEVCVYVCLACERARSFSVLPIDNYYTPTQFSLSVPMAVGTKLPYHRLCGYDRMSYPKPYIQGFKDFGKGRGPMRRTSHNRAPEQEGGHSPTDVEGALLWEVRRRGPLLT